MRARTTNWCPVVRARTKRSSSIRSASVSETSGGFGPGMSDTSHRKMLQFIRFSSPKLKPPAYIRLTVLAGAWSDLDWDEAEKELDRIRHESNPTPPITDL